jgi:hypothetical protein
MYAKAPFFGKEIARYNQSPTVKVRLTAIG